MKLPNGYGSVYKLSGKRRKPYIARKTSGWLIDDEQGSAKQKYITIGYFQTKAEAITALANYNENPYDISVNSITFSEVYEKWAQSHFENIVPSAQRTWVSAFNHSKPLHNMRMKDIRANHLEQTIKDADVGQATKQRMKSLYNLMYKYCLKCDICDKNYAELCESVKNGKPVIERIPYTEKEIQALWDNINFPFVDMILIGIYSGWRPQELSIIKVSDVNLSEKTFFGGLKTDAGRNRYVPIHSRIYDLVKKRFNEAIKIKSDYLFNDNGPMTYDKYRGRFNKVNKFLNQKHRPHDTRHTFITMAKDAGIDDFILKLIVGHAIRDVTEKIYTHRTIEQLRKEIEKIT
ncbi:MAG: tyrosine-type recombinase/integrase [Lachnospiraceae bacterium]|nr:tyrosine-type recombinase/integrase [Lachnospiraceae bacterium]MBQ9608129.1 tyrosine-type recombinase/integrase [Lachnospiraceae bacterium]